MMEMCVHYIATIDTVVFVNMFDISSLCATRQIHSKILNHTES